MSIENPFPAPAMREITEEQSRSPEIAASPEKGPYRRFEKPVFSNAPFADELAAAYSRLASQCNQTEELWLDSVKGAFFQEFIESYQPITHYTIQLMEETQSQIENLKNRVMELS